MRAYDCVEERCGDAMPVKRKEITTKDLAVLIRYWKKILKSKQPDSDEAKAVQETIEALGRTMDSIKSGKIKLFQRIPQKLTE
jgi:ribosome-binding ATPase YchF (GTP1/OBG family)